MIEITFESVMTIGMFSKKGWERLSREVPVSEYRTASDIKLAEGFDKFVYLWTLEHAYIDMDVVTMMNPSKKYKNGKEVFILDPDATMEDALFYRGNLYQDMLGRWADYLLCD